VNYVEKAYYIRALVVLLILILLVNKHKNT